MKQKLFFISFLLTLFFSTVCNAQETFRNPIISGFHPDPSICRVGDDFYLVTSSFEWFPGIPVFHSRDLMHWEQIGYVLDRPSQLAMKEGLRPSQGLWAPTIRYHEGIYYVICTAQGAGGNFYVTAESPYGPWSEPVFLKDAPGIDPSLFFDDDGTCWYCGSINETPKEDHYPCEDRIYIQQLDVKEGRLIGPRTTVCTGHAINAPYAEAPHIYKIDGKYMLMIAEGGTWNNHAVTVFKSDSIMGPYVAGIANPVLTHRHLGNDVDITTIGHADLVQTKDGQWWSVMLGVRPLQGYTMLGRETFITPVEFQHGWPVFNPGIGRVLAEEHVTGLAPCPFDVLPDKDEFDEPELRLCWNFLRTPFSLWHEIKDGRLILDLRKESVADLANPSLIARRIEHFDFRASTIMEFAPKREGEESGLIMLQNEKNNYRLVLRRTDGKNNIALIKTDKGTTTIVAEMPWKDKKACLMVEARGLEYQFAVGQDESEKILLGAVQDASLLSSNHAGGFIGPYIGMYATSNGQDSRNHVSFLSFTYSGDSF